MKYLYNKSQSLTDLQIRDISLQNLLKSNSKIYCTCSGAHKLCKFILVRKLSLLETMLFATMCLKCNHLRITVRLIFILTFLKHLKTKYLQFGTHEF